MNNRSKKFRLPLALAATALLASNAYADLVSLGPIDFGGTGLGSVNTILTVTSPANSTSETGTVSWNGSADVISGSQVMTGASQTLTRTFGDLGVLAPNSLAVVFNASEPGNGDNGITLSALTFSAYTPTGVNIFNASIAAPIAYPDTFTGAGNSGFVFGLDAAQAASFATAVSNSGFSFASLRGGLSATADNATGGVETFFIANAPLAPVPEPQSYALLLGGLGAIGFAVRRRAR